MEFKPPKEHWNNSGIYRIRNLENDKFYIGSAVAFRSRWHVHSHHLKYDTHPNYHLLAHKNKYGIENLVFEIVEFVDETDKLLEREQWWLDQTRCWDRKIGFNLCPTASSQLGREMPDIHREKVGKRSVGNSYRKGFAVSDETKAQISKAQGSRKVAKFTLDGDLVKVYDYIGLTEKDGHETNSIRKVTTGECKQYRGYFWRFLDDGEDPNVLTKKEIFIPSFKKVLKKVIVCDLDGNFIAEYTSVRKVSDDFNLPMKRSLDCCKGLVESVGEYKLKYTISHV